ncbi:uncharacterized protein LOC112590101, partial [Harpegnathos saltator]|uniref:uncharacterized protein LOC112590101 n=1 Tax=Harpegnathos saltator TaxID=610380 RepID=UPI000DBEDA5C
MDFNHLNKNEIRSIIALIQSYQDCFYLPGEQLTSTHVLQHRIPTIDEYPINTKQYRFPQTHKQEIDKQVQELLANSIIRPSQSPYNTPIWIVPKKTDQLGNKRWRMVLDFRLLNDKTIGDAYPLPNIIDILDQLGGAQYFSVFDLASGFHQIEMDPRDRHKTAFTTSFGHYEFNRMPFGSKNAPATFQRLMDIVLSGIQGQEAFVYLDDIVVYASSLEEHKHKFEKLMQRLKEANLKLQPDKCQFLRREVNYLGHVIRNGGVKPDPKKLEAVHEFPIPKTPNNIKQFLGLTDNKPLMWFQNAQDANMRILRWRLKLSEYDYDVVYKAGKTNVNADALSRNPIDSPSKDCKMINTRSKLNPNDPKDAEIIQRLLAEDSDTEESHEEDGHEGHLTNDHPHIEESTEENVRDTHPSDDRALTVDSLENISPLTDGETMELPKTQTVEALVHMPGPTNIECRDSAQGPTEDSRAIMTRSRAKQLTQTAELYEEVVKPKKRNLPPKPLPEDTDEEDNDCEPLATINTKSQSKESNLIDSRDLHFLRKDNLLYFTDISGNPVDDGGNKLFERQEMPKVTNLSISIAKFIKRNKRYHIILPISEDQKEGPTMILKNITQAIINLRQTAESMNLASISVAKSGYILNVPWNDIKTKFQTGFLDSAIRIIICKGLIKYPPGDIREAILQEMHCTPVGGHKGVTKTYNRIRQNYYWENLKSDVRRHIRQCLQCQLKKLVRVKTKQLMVITDTPGWTFDKIAMDIVGSLPRTKN